MNRAFYIKIKKVKVILIAVSLLVLSTLIPMRVEAIDLSMPPIEPKAQNMGVIDDFINGLSDLMSGITSGNTTLSDILDKLGEIYDWLTKDTNDVLTGLLQDWSKQMTETIASMFQLVSDTLDGTSNISIIGNKAYTKTKRHKR